GADLIEDAAAKADLRADLKRQFQYDQQRHHRQDDGQRPGMARRSLLLRWMPPSHIFYNHPFLSDLSWRLAAVAISGGGGADGTAEHNPLKLRDIIGLL